MIFLIVGSSESRRLYNEAMREGSIRAQINKILLYGAPGTGKSSSMDLFVGNPPRGVRTSTPLAARPITMFHVGVTSKEWKKLPPEERRRILSRAIAAHSPPDATQSPEGSDFAESSDSCEDSDSGGEMSTGMEGGINPKRREAHTTEDRSSTHDRNLRLHPVSLSSPTAARKPKPKRKSSLPSITTHDQLIRLMDECLESDKPLSTFRKLYLIDSGGQPQFHEVLPIFLRRMSLYIFVFKLSEELATKPMVEYFDGSGKRVGTPYRSAQSNEQLLKHCLRTMHTHRSDSKSGGECSRIMIVGTHRDEEHKCTSESRQEKNKKLADILLPAFEDEVIFYKQSELIFPVNAKDPAEFDKSIAKNVQGLVLDECEPVSIDVPLQYFSLEILLEEVSLSLDRGVLSKEECLRAAKDLYFDEHSLDAALQFLDEISAVFYFPEILEGVVFTNPQVLLDKVTELVEKIFRLRKNIGGEAIGLTRSWQKFKEHGIVSLKLLQREEFNKHYVPEIFAPVDLVKLFKELLIIADFSASEYIMPALLPVLEKEKVREYRVSNDSTLAPLALSFPLGGPRLGTYCSLTCFLVSRDNQFPCPWKIVLLPHSNTPACLNRNCTRFSVPGYPGFVTLIDTFTHFEVHVHTAEKVCSKMSSFVSRAIFAGLRKATLVLGYNNSIPSKALLCPCDRDGSDPHVATFGDGIWICCRNPIEFGDLTSGQLPWCEQEDPLPTNGMSVYAYNVHYYFMSIILLHAAPLDLRTVQCALWDAKCKWYNLGLELGLDKSTLDAIKVNCQEVEDCFREVLSKWLNLVTPSWNALVKALRAPTVDFPHIASKIESKYI